MAAAVYSQMACGTLNKQFTKSSEQVAAPPSIVCTSISFCISLFTFLCCHLSGKVPKTGLNHQADTSQVTLPQVREKRVEREERVERANCKKHFWPKVLGTAENTSYGRKSLFRPKITVTAVSPKLSNYSVSITAVIRP